MFSSTFSWFFFFFINYDDIFSDLGLGNSGSLLLYLGSAVLLSFLVFSAVIGSLLSEKYSRRKFLFLWIILGIISTATLLVSHGTILLLISSAFLGISFGLGFPSVFAYLSDSTAIGERGRVTGTVILVTFILVISGLLATASLVGYILLSIVLRAIGFFALALDSCDRIKGKGGTWRSILTYRDFVFYIFPFLMFNIANGLSSFISLRIPTTPNYAWAISLGSALNFLGAGIFAFISGILADRIGRKQPIIIGLVLLGISYGFLGITLSPQSWFTFQTLSGAAWGFIICVYFTIPGDLAFPGSQERFYALMSLVPFILYASFSGPAELIGTSPPVSLLSPFLSIILFLSVVPILRVSETLPENKIRERKFKEHVEKLGKIIEESKKKS